MQEIRVYGNGPFALLSALTEIGIDPRLVGFTPYEAEAVCGREEAWQKMLQKRVAESREITDPGPRCMILVQSEKGWRLIFLSYFLTPVVELLTAQRVRQEELMRIALIEHFPADPWDGFPPYRIGPAPSFFFITVARRES